MKKKEKFVKKSFTYINLYLEDLLRIEEILINNFDKYQIDDGENYFDNLDELVTNYANKKKISCLNMVGKNNYKSGINKEIYLQFRKNKIQLDTIYDENLEGERLRIEEIIRDSSLKPKIIYTILQLPQPYLNILGTSLTFLIIGILIVAIIATYQPDRKLIETHPVESTIGIALLSFIFLSYLYITSRPNSINLINKKSKIGFLARNRDNLILAIISALIGALAFKLFELIF